LKGDNFNVAGIVGNGRVTGGRRWRITFNSGGVKNGDNCSDVITPPFALITFAHIRSLSASISRKSSGYH